MTTTIPPISSFPDAPDPNDPDNFNTDAIAWVSHWNDTAVGEFNAFKTAANTQAGENNATAAQVALDAAAAEQAAAAAGAILWVSGTTYAVGDTRISPANLQAYRRKTNGAGTTDPASDTTNWTRVVIAGFTRQTARTSNTILGATDHATEVPYSSGTFTQTFTAAATLGAGWWCVLANEGSGDVTLDPDSSEQIDGLTSYKMYPGEKRWVYCDGTAFNSIVLKSFARTYTSSDTFTKPPGYSSFEGEIWGAGGSGARGNTVSGGAGGACVPFKRPSSDFGTETITIAGTTSGRGTNGAGSDGSNSTLGSLVTGYGGQGGPTSGGGARGGGTLSAGSSIGSGKPASDASPYSSNGFGGGYGSGGANSGDSHYGGGAGGGYVTSTSVAAGGSSYYGGGGGGGHENTAGNGAGGTSIRGGNGGAGSASNASGESDGAAPGGGGGGTGGGTSGSGARGECRIRGVI